MEHLTTTEITEIIFIFIGLMLSIIMLLIIVFWLSAVKSRQSLRKGFRAIRNHLFKADFTITHKIGYHSRFNGVASYYLYMDEVKGKWMFTSPYHDNLDLTIQDFEDLYDYDFFDIESKEYLDHRNQANNITRMIYKITGAFAGFIVGKVAGNVIFSSRLSSDVTAVGSAGLASFGTTKLHDFITNKRNQNDPGASAGYGLVFVTTNNDENDPLICNFLTAGNRRTRIRLSHRNDKRYKKNIHVITAMVKIFDAIMLYNNVKGLTPVIRKTSFLHDTNANWKMAFHKKMLDVIPHKKAPMKAIIIMALFIGVISSLAVRHEDTWMQWIRNFQNANNVAMLEMDSGIIRVGDVISFGNFEWYVLSLNGRYNYALLITREVVAQRAFHDAQLNMSWMHSDLRIFLNYTFYQTFNEEERNRIRLATVRNPGIRAHTQDKIFILSRDEINDLFVSDNQPRLGSGWWTRTAIQANATSFDRYFITSTRSSGVEVRNVLSHEVGVRPAIRLYLNDLSLPERYWITWDNQTVLIGDMITFAQRYWRILSMDANGSALIMADIHTTVRSYHNENIQITWRDSALRHYLNNTFFYTLSDNDRQLVLPTLNQNDDGGGNTLDYVFLLSGDEAEAVIGGALAFGSIGWWLRSSTGNGQIASRSTISDAVGTRTILSVRNVTVTAAHEVHPVLRLSVDVHRS